MLSILLLLLYLDKFPINYGFSLYCKSPSLLTKTNHAIMVSYYTKQFKLQYENKIIYHKSYHVLYNNKDNYDNNMNQFTPPKLDYDECYYEVLEVHPKCDSVELKKAYYRIVFKYHPDNKETEFEKELSNKQMMVINGAYRVLKDLSKRNEYNQQCLKGLFGANAGIKGSGKNDPNVVKYQYSKEQIEIIMKNMKTTTTIPNNNFISKPATTSTTTTATTTTTSTATTATTTTSTVSSNSKQDMNPPNHINKNRSPSTSSPSASRFWSKYADNMYTTTDDNDTTTTNNNNPKKQQYNNNDEDDEEEEDYYSGFGSDGYFTKHYKSYVSSSNNNNKQTSSSYSSSNDGNSFDTMDSIHVIGRGDGSISSLKLHLKSLRLIKQRKENILLLDNRDWGEVTDYSAIEKRLRDIQEIKNLELSIADVEDEIESITYCSGGRDIIERNYDNNQIPWWKHPNHPYNQQPQPQPQSSQSPDPWEQFAGSSSNSRSGTTTTTRGNNNSNNNNNRGGSTKKRPPTSPPYKKPPPTERLWRDRNKP